MIESLHIFFNVKKVLELVYDVRSAESYQFHKFSDAMRILELRVELLELRVRQHHVNLREETVSPYQGSTIFAVVPSACVECIASSAADVALRR